MNSTSGWLLKINLVVEGSWCFHLCRG